MGDGRGGPTGWSAASRTTTPGTARSTRRAATAITTAWATGPNGRGCG